MKNCQVCGGRMFNYKDMGINGDGSINQDYCHGCYRNGNFTNKAEQQNYYTRFTDILLPSLYFAYDPTNGLGTNQAPIAVAGLFDNGDNEMEYGE